MKKLSKQQLMRKAELIEQLSEAKDALMKVIEEYNDNHTDLWNKIDSAMSDYNERSQEATDFCQEIVNPYIMQKAIDILEQNLTKEEFMELHLQVDGSPDGWWEELTIAAKRVDPTAFEDSSELKK